MYDIWDEKFSVRITRGLGAELRAMVRTADEAIWRADGAVAAAGRRRRRLRPGTRYVVMARGDLNPISEDLLADVRRWLVQPARGQRELGAGDSFFGSFVSIFVNPRIEDSERQVRFVSQQFVLPQPAAASAPPAPARAGAAGRTERRSREAASARPLRMEDPAARCSSSRSLPLGAAAYSMRATLTRVSDPHRAAPGSGRKDRWAARSRSTGPTSPR